MIDKPVPIDLVVYTRHASATAGNLRVGMKEGGPVTCFINPARWRRSDGYGIALVDHPLRR
jgi:hypothetical protein